MKNVLLTTCLIAALLPVAGCAGGSQPEKKQIIIESGGEEREFEDGQYRPSSTTTDSAGTEQRLD